MLKFNRKNKQKLNWVDSTIYYTMLEPIFKRFLIYSKNVHFWKYFTNLRAAHSKLNFVKYKNVCILTGRTRSVYRLFNLSRLKVREYAQQGYFVGFSKTSW